MEEDYKKWLSQFRKGYLELCTLITLKEKGSLHGVALLRQFEAVELLVNEGTLYPLLNRMEQNGWLESSWSLPENGGHPKREYSMSQKGGLILPKLLETYKKHQLSLTRLQEEKDEH